MGIKLHGAPPALSQHQGPSMGLQQVTECSFGIGKLKVGKSQKPVVRVMGFRL